MIYLFDVENITDFLKNRLSEKRFNHSLNVAAECRKLAEHYGEDPEKAYFAGLVHDICKELPADEMKKMAAESGLGVTSAELQTKALWHAVAGAAFVRDSLMIEDKDIINAVRFHTIGRAGMSRLEEIVYIGDLISADRTYNGVKKFRKLAYQDMDMVMLDALIFSIVSVTEKKGLIPEYTLEAYNQYALTESKRAQEGK